MRVLKTARNGLGMLILTLIGLVAVLLAAAALYSAIEAARIEARYPPVGRFASVDGVTLHYVDVPADDPEATTLLFFHGASANLRDPVLAFSHHYAGRFRMIFVDRPGHGYSTRGPRPMAAPAEQAETIHALIAQLGISKVVAIGHSWGGAVAAAYAVNHPEAVGGLMLIAPATHPWPSGVEWYYRLSGHPILGWIFVRTLAVPVGEWLMTSATSVVFSPDPVPPDYIDRVGVPLVLRPAEFAANAEDVVELYPNVVAYQSRYREIKAPTVIVTGDSDTVVAPWIHAEALAREIKGSRIIRIPGAGHMPQYAHGPVILAAIDDLAEQSRTRQLAAR